LKVENAIHIKPVANAYLGLGSNLGDRRKQLLAAIEHLTEMAGNIPVSSGFYETAPWGSQSPYPFLNAAVQLETSLSPHELLAVTQQIECELGRTGKSIDRHYADRTIDIDILMYDELILQTPELMLPHPLMHQRPFVLQPLAEIAPNLLHPVLNKTIEELRITVSG
jgi:2-amino-4-hydroxy-6-hydroxymethyldihydropteridine diphosphokinase